jgi:hypothetical protein
MSDYKSITDELNVLKRNPGINSSLTEQYITEVNANMDFLKRKARLFKTAASSGSTEGFADINTVDSTLELVSANDTNPGLVDTSERATKADLQEFSSKIQGEIMRLSASGTSDPIIQSRVASLTNMKKQIDDIIVKLQYEQMKPEEVPLYKYELESAFPVLSQPDEPLPKVLHTVGLPPGLGNMLPSNLQNDPEVTNEISNLIDKYASEFLKGVSVSFGVKYTSEREAHKPNDIPMTTMKLPGVLPTVEEYVSQQRDKSADSTIDKTGFPSPQDLNRVNDPAQFRLAYQGSVGDVYANFPQLEGRSPTHFDWYGRSLEITDQIRMRGLNPEDFGAMKRDAMIKLKNDLEFSWKGYTKMICNRLMTTMDPNLPETCGCPPSTWAGWGIQT